MNGIGQLNRVVTFEVWSYTQDNAGGTTGTVTDTWQQRANIIDRNSYRSALGAVSDDQAQQQWSYQYKITVRALPPRTVLSNNTLLYEGFRYTINEVSLNTEGHKRFYVLRCSKTETWVGTS
jgi:hypothetical protein